MIIDCISDLHGHYPKLEGGDLLIVAGDLTAHQTTEDYLLLGNWIVDSSAKYEEIIFIAGNHDTRCESLPFATHHIGSVVPNCYYLCDSGTEFEWLETEDTKWGPRHLDGCRSLKVKIWVSPWSKTFEGMNPSCKAFTVDTEEELAEKWALIPDDVDILVTHSPAYGFGDLVTGHIKDKRGNQSIFQHHVGSCSLVKWVSNHVQTLKLHVSGHIHEGYGIWDVRAAKEICGDSNPSPILVNCSHVNERYKPVNKPIRVIF